VKDLLYLYDRRFDDSDAYPPIAELMVEPHAIWLTGSLFIIVFCRYYGGVCIISYCLLDNHRYILFLPILMEWIASRYEVLHRLLAMSPAS